MTRSILENGWWALLLLATIMVSCLMLALESPVEELTVMHPRNMYKIDLMMMMMIIGTETLVTQVIHPRNMYKIDLVLFGIFGVEFVLKIVDHGVLWEHPQAYFRQAWNCLDAFILGCTAFDLIIKIIGVNSSTLSVLGCVFYA